MTLPWWSKCLITSEKSSLQKEKIMICPTSKSFSVSIHLQALDNQAILFQQPWFRYAHTHTDINPLIHLMHRNKSNSLRMDTQSHWGFLGLQTGLLIFSFLSFSPSSSSSFSSTYFHDSGMQGRILSGESTISFNVLKVKASSICCHCCCLWSARLC